MLDENRVGTLLSHVAGSVTVGICAERWPSGGRHGEKGGGVADLPLFASLLVMPGRESAGL